MSYMFASTEMVQACNGLHDYLMEVNGCFNNRSSTIDCNVTVANVTFYPCDERSVNESVRLSNKIKDILCARFLDVSDNEIEERLDACIQALDLNIEFMSSFDTANAAAAHLIKDARMFLN